MLGLRDVLFITPTSSSLHQQTQIISSDHHPSLPLPSSAALGVSVGIFPLLTATPCLPPPPPPPNQTADDVTDRNRSLEHLKRTQDFGFGNNGSDNHVKSGGGGGDSGADGSLAVCRDCGNRAKKECEYQRCRTCCKGRGNHCSTHVKSTWVPAARRRERQMLVVMDGVSGDGGGSSGSSSAGAKRPRVLIPPQSTGAAVSAAAPSHASTSNATTPRSFETTSNHQDASFKKSLPGQVRAPAVFRCHRVTAINSGVGELAYQATVNIGGHVFKGFLYDQGLDAKNAFPYLSHLHLDSGNHHRE